MKSLNVLNEQMEGKAKVMPKITVTMQIIIFIAYLGLVVPIYFYCMNDLMKYLKNNYHRTWTEMGQPSFTKVSYTNFKRLQRFIFTPHNFDDKDFATKIKRAKYSLIIGYVSTGILFAAALLSFFTSIQQRGS